MTIYWTSDDCHGQAILTLHLSVGQVILYPYFDHWVWPFDDLIGSLGHHQNMFFQSFSHDPALRIFWNTK